MIIVYLPSEKIREGLLEKDAKPVCLLFSDEPPEMILE
jgi:hypothetical protein